MQRKAVYYDERYGASSFLDDRVYKERPKDYEVLDYFSISKWLDEAGKGDLLVFAQDVVPYTAYEITPFSQDSKLLRFLQRGGTVVWVGDVPFFYRLHCYEREMRDKLNETKEALKRSVAFTPMPNFYLQKFGPCERGDKVCALDIIGGFYADLEVEWMGLDYKHLGFYKLNEVCYLGSKTNVRPTLLGGLLGYEDAFSVRPTKYTTRIYPLTITTLEGVCRGRYAGSWIAEVGGGAFVRLYDDLDGVEVSKIFEIGERIASLKAKA